MKKVLFVLVTLLALAGCAKSDNDKASAIVKEWFSNNLNDPSSLEIVSINNVETDSVLNCEDDEDYKLKQDELILAYKYAKKAIEDDIPNLAKEYEEKAKNYEKELEQMKENFKPYSRGKITTVKYRAKNAFGALTLEEKTFRFDNEMTKIITQE
jgi:hypothetical protein